MAAAKKGLFSSIAKGASSAAEDDWADEMAEAIASGDTVTIADELRKLEARCKAAYEGDGALETPAVEGAEV